MGLFSGSPSVFPVEGNNILVTAGKTVIARLNELPPPRSLCELQINEEDYQYLCIWARQLTSAQLRGWLDGTSSRMMAFEIGSLRFSYAEVVGCLLLLLASEAARREAREGYVWPAVYSRFDESSGKVLFVSKQPTTRFKEAMETSARKLQLRHVFGQEGTQEYYLSVYLQFGFTQKGMARLPNWLAGQPTSEAIQYLILQSESFLKLWRTLRNFRKNNIPESRARQAIAESPWVLPDWADELLKRARERIELGTADSVQAGSTEQAPPQFLDTPCLQWNKPSEPSFSSTVVNLADFELTSDRYHVKRGVKQLAILVLTDDGSYFSYPEEIILPSESPEFVITMVDDRGDAPASQLLQLWDPMEDIELFDLQTGKSLGDPWSARIRPGREYGLLVRDDLEVEPPDLLFHVMGRGDHSKKLYLLRADDKNPVQVILAGEELWNSSSDRDDSVEMAEPAWTQDVIIRLIPDIKDIHLTSSSNVNVSIEGLGTDTLLEYVKIGTKPRDRSLDFHRLEDGTYLTEEFDATELAARQRSASSKFEFKVGLRRGDQVSIIKKIHVLNVSGVLRASDNGWQTVNPQERLSVGDAKQFVYKILSPSSKKDLALMEGPIFLRRLWNIPRSLEFLGGYGARLGIRSPYNWMKVEDLLTVSEEVYDPGIFERVSATDNGSLMLYLHQPLEPGPRHQIVFWKFGSSPQILPAKSTIKDINNEYNVWEVSCYDLSQVDEIFVALAYDGARIGAWWPLRPNQILTDGSSAWETAAMLRWMHAPIVSRDWIKAVRSFAYRYPAMVLSAWLRDRDNGLPTDLDHGLSEEQWMSAIRQVYSDWCPRHLQWVLATICALGAESRDNPIPEAFQALLRLDPLVMGRVARVWKQSPELPCLGSENKRGMIRRMRLLVAGLPDNSTSSDMDLRKKELLDQASKQMKVDPNFLSHIEKKVLRKFNYNDLDQVHKNNVVVALNIAPFREYLGIQVLSSLM